MSMLLYNVKSNLNYETLLFRCSAHRSKAIPDTMVNIEVWSEAGFNLKPWTQVDLVRDLGPLGPTGRFGWFVPTSTVENMWSTKKIIVDHWRAFQNDVVTELFSLDDAQTELKNLLLRGMNRSI